MPPFIVAHAQVFLTIGIIGSVFFPALKHALPDSFKAAHPKVTDVIGALADLFVNVPSALQKIFAKEEPKS